MAQPDLNSPGRISPNPEVSEYLIEQVDLLEIIQEAVIAVDPDLKITFWNRAAGQIYGWLQREAIGQDIHLLLGTEPGAEAPLGLSGQEASTGTTHVEVIHSSRDGRRLYIDSFVRLLHNADGEFTGSLYINHDITPLKEAEQALRVQAALLDYLPDAVIASDRDFRLTAWNKAAEQQYGWTAGEVLGQPGLEILQTEFPEKDKAAVLAGINEAGYYSGEATQVRKDGRRILVEVRSIVLRDPEGSITGYLSINRDITERKREHENLLSGLARIDMQRRLLKHREQERQQIARDLHDGPVQELTGIYYRLRELLDGDLPVGVAEEVEGIAASVQDQMAELRSFAGELRPPILSKFGVGRTIRAHLETYQARHPELKIQFVEHQTGELLPEDVRLALFRIYQESLSNIAKHAGASEIVVRLNKNDEEAVLEIEDNGRGFVAPQDWLNLARHGHLGMVGMRERAEAIGGSLTLTSSPGRGTLVRVHVPLISRPVDE